MVRAVREGLLVGPTDCHSEKEESRRRLAGLSLPALLSRSGAALVNYIADQSLRGGLPFPRLANFFLDSRQGAEMLNRAREEELVYVLRKLLDLRLWPGSLWAAFSDNPTKYSSSQPSEYERRKCRAP
jgi:hypothetical protein